MDKLQEDFISSYTLHSKPIRDINPSQDTNKTDVIEGFNSNYKLRYKFSGNFSFNYENNIQSYKGFDDFRKSANYNLRWSFTQDGKSSPNSRFSASVNLGSSKYYRESLNEVNTSQFLNNTLSSSISYYKNFVNTPFNVNATITHSQNTNTETINMTLPTIQSSVSRIFPFSSDTGTKKGIIQNIDFQYNLRAENRIVTTDSSFFKKEMWAATCGMLFNFCRPLAVLYTVTL